jgi:hypothetical protein
MSDSNPEMTSKHPANFHHPYQPYDIQLEFMRTVYDVLQKGNGQVGILESPTGTVRPPFHQPNHPASISSLPFPGPTPVLTCPS